MTAIREPVIAGVEALRENPLRSLLSTLGVLIGVAALVAILALSDGLERFSREQIARTTDLHTILVTPKSIHQVDGISIRRDDTPEFTPAYAHELELALAPVEASTALFAIGSGWITVPGDTSRHATLFTATTPAAEAMLPRPLAAGRFLTPSDLSGDSSVLVVSASLAEMITFGSLDTAEILGTRLRWNDVDWTIAGVLETDPADRVNRAWMPLTPQTVRLLDPDLRRPAALRVRVESIESIPPAMESIEGWLASRFGSAWSEQIDVATNKRRSDQARQAMLAFKLVLGAIAGISLIVGGIGIMNVLLASVSERTREIGMRKAAGATGRDISLQFLAESLAITSVGSLLGILLGMTGAGGVAAVVRSFTGAPVEAAFTWQSVALAAGAAFVVGLAFGTWPARRAARMSPIEALRTE